MYSRDEKVLCNNIGVKFEKLVKPMLGLHASRIIKLHNDVGEELYFRTIDVKADGDCYYSAVCRSEEFRKATDGKYFPHYAYDLRRDVTRFVLDKKYEELPLGMREVFENNNIIENVNADSYNAEVLKHSERYFWADHLLIGLIILYAYNVSVCSISNDTNDRRTEDGRIRATLFDPVHSSKNGTYMSNYVKNTSKFVRVFVLSSAMGRVGQKGNNHFSLCEKIKYYDGIRVDEMMFTNCRLNEDEYFGYDEETINKMLDKNSVYNNFRLDIVSYIYCRDVIPTRLYYSLKKNDGKSDKECLNKIIEENSALLDGMNRIVGEEKIRGKGVDFLDLLIKEASKYDIGKKYISALMKN